jgi:hypothetical protein
LCFYDFFSFLYFMLIFSLRFITPLMLQVNINKLNITNNGQLRWQVLFKCIVVTWQCYTDVSVFLYDTIPFINLIYTTLPSIISSYPFIISSSPTIILIIFSNYHNHLLYLPYLCSSFTHLVDLIILLSLDFMKVPRSASKYMTLFPSSLFYHKSSSR